MAIEDFFDAEVGIAVAVTALATSPQVRNTVRRGVVYGLAGILRAGDAMGAAARGVAQTAQETAQSGGSVARDIPEAGARQRKGATRATGSQA